MLRLSEFILNFILNSVWQVTAIFMVAWVASWILRNGPARYRHVLWVIALVACLVVPLLTATRIVPEWISNLQVVTSTSGQTKLDQVAPIVSKSSSEFDGTVAHVSSRRSTTVTTTPRSVLFLAFGYAVFVLVRALRLVRFWRRKEKLRRSASATGVTPGIEAAAQSCRKLLNVRSVPVRLSPSARVPYTIGTLRPLIVLPEAFSANVDESRLLSVIGHEMAHVARRDFLTNLFCELVALASSFHPLTFLIKQQLERTRELACDELVTSYILAPKVYARSLLWAADVSRQYQAQAFMLSIFDGKILEERIVRIMRSNTRIPAGLARTFMFAAVAVLCLSALSLSFFSLELQTEVRAAVTRSIQTTPEPPVIQEPAPQTTVAVARRESQGSAADADERAAQACNAAKGGDVKSVELLIAMLGDDRKSQLIRCWEGTRWSPALAVFKQSSPGEQAALALASLGPPAFRPLANQLDNSNPSVRRNAAWAIGELTNMAPSMRWDAVPQLITLLSDSDAWVRMAAARALGELHDRRAVAQLVANLADDNWRVRELVVWALSEMKDARAVTALCNILLSDTRAEVRRGAAEALGEIASAEAIPALKQALQDSAPVVSEKAAWAISEIEG